MKRTAACWIAGILIVFAIHLKPAEAIMCYRCTNINNTSPFQCNEFLKDDFDLQPESCDDVFAAQYCVKHVGRYEGGIGTKRFCSSVHMGNYCDFVKQPGDELLYRTCVFTCDTDGCNSAMTSRLSKMLCIFSVLFLLVCSLSHRR